MKENLISNHLSPEPQQLQMWFCPECNAVHFRVGVVMLNFTRNEFARLAESCFDIYSEIFTVKFRDFHAQAACETDADVLSSETIA